MYKDQLDYPDFCEQIPPVATFINELERMDIANVKKKLPYFVHDQIGKGRVVKVNSEKIMHGAECYLVKYRIIM
jgi:hypothetical protein